MNRRRISVLATVLGIASAAHADDPEQLLVLPCTGCHAATSTMPAIAGRPVAELESSMRALKSGDRESTLMKRVLAGYSDEDITRLAVVLSSLSSEVR